MQISINSYLDGFSGKAITYIPNPGNAGDSVIAAATYQSLDKAGIKYNTDRPSTLDATGKILFYGGGGNLGTSTSFSYRLLSKYHKTAKKVVVLPHTIHRINSLASEFGDNVDLICRERVSYDYALQHARNANIYLADDMAFNLDTNHILGINTKKLETSIISYIYNRFFTNDNIVNWHDLSRSRKHEFLLHEALTEAQSECLYCYRTDAESKGRSLPPGNLDLSAIFQFGVETQKSAYLATHTLLSFLKRFKEIHTDRLHLCISAALLGLTVHFHANSYYKCKAVYDFSMKDRFKNIIWED